MTMMLLCMFGLFISRLKKFKNMSHKNIILNAQSLQEKSKTIQIESKIKSTT